jgi:hypothetical protein
VETWPADPGLGAPAQPGKEEQPRPNRGGEAACPGLACWPNRERITRPGRGRRVSAHPGLEVPVQPGRTAAAQPGPEARCRDGPARLREMPAHTGKEIRPSREEEFRPTDGSDARRPARLEADRPSRGRRSPGPAGILICRPSRLRAFMPAQAGIFRPGLL